MLKDTIRPQPLLVVILLGLLIQSLLFLGLEGRISAQNEPDKAEPTIEELEKIARKKLKESYKAIQNKMDFLVNSLSMDESKASDARTRLVSYGHCILGDGRTVAEHLVTTYFLKTKSKHLRDQVKLVLLEQGHILRKHKTRVLPPLLEAAKKADHRLSALIDVLITMNLPEALRELEPLLTHESTKVRANILRLLGLTGTKNDGVKVFPALESPDGEVKVTAIQALVDLNCAKGAKKLIPLISSTDYIVSRAAIEALAFFKSKESIPMLLKALERTKDEPRSRALLVALGRIGPALKVSLQTNVEHVLKSYLSSKKGSLVREAGYALAKLGLVSSEVERALTRNLRDQLSKDPKDFMTRLDLARRLKNLGMFSGTKTYFIKAVKEYKAVLKEDKRRRTFPGLLTSTTIDLAGCHAWLGQFKSAARYLDKVPKSSIPLPMILKDNPDFNEMRKDSQYQRFFQ